MSTVPEQPTPCGCIDRPEAIGCEPDRIVELLNDDGARAVYQRVETPTTVAAVAAELDLPQSTAYRKIDELREAGLVRQFARRSTGNEPAYFVRAIDCVSITYDDPLRIECTRNGTTLYCEP